MEYFYLNENIFVFLFLQSHLPLSIRLTVKVCDRAYVLFSSVIKVLYTFIFAFDL